LYKAGFTDKSVMTHLIELLKINRCFDKQANTSTQPLIKVIIMTVIKLYIDRYVNKR